MIREALLEARRLAPHGDEEDKKELDRLRKELVHTQEALTKAEAEREEAVRQTDLARYRLHAALDSDQTNEMMVERLELQRQLHERELAACGARAREHMESLENGLEAKAEEYAAELAACEEIVAQAEKNQDRIATLEAKLNVQRIHHAQELALLRTNAFLT